VKTIKVLGISASPRKNGNSEYLLDLALEEAKKTAPDQVETELYSIANKKYSGCISCFYCVPNKGKCAFSEKDDTQEILDKWLAADAIIYSLPVYHMGIPAQLKAIIDRLGMYLMTSNDLKVTRTMKAVGCIAQGDCLFSGQEASMMQIIHHALVTGCVYVPGSSPECYIGAGGWTMRELDKDVIKRRSEEGRLEQQFTTVGAASIGKLCVQTVQIIHSGVAANQEQLKQEGPYDFLLKKMELI